MNADLEPSELVARLASAGATFAVTPEGALRVRAPKTGTLTPEVVAALRAHKQAVVDLAVWNQQAAEALLRQTLARVAAQFNPAWRERFRADSRWLEPQARVEAAFLTFDMVALRPALAAYETYAQAVFTEYAGDSGGDGKRDRKG